MLYDSKPDIGTRYPGSDGNDSQRAAFLKWIEQILIGIDRLKAHDHVYLMESNRRQGDLNGELIWSSKIPAAGIPMEEVNHKLLSLLHSLPLHTRYELTDTTQMASIPGILGLLTACLVNGSHVPDAYGPAGTEAKARVTAMLSRLVGYNSSSGGYTPGEGQEAIFTALRIAIAKLAPDAPRSGVPRKLYVLCSEAAHDSLLRSMEAVGIGSGHLIRVRTLPDNSMDLVELKDQLIRVIRSGGTPICIVATTGTSDAMGIDDVEEIYHLAAILCSVYNVPRPHIHADSVLGGIFAFFNGYDFAANPFSFGPETLHALYRIQCKMAKLRFADSLCFDFHKLGQLPYSSSMLLLKDAKDLQLIDLTAEETPSRSFGIYSALLAFGTEGYQQMLGHLVEVNIAFRKALKMNIPEAVIVNRFNPGNITLFRIYPGGVSRFAEELNGECTKDEVERTNLLNERLFERLGQRRERMSFDHTKKYLSVLTEDQHTMPLYAAKLSVISPHTGTEHVDEIVLFLKEIIDDVIVTER
ncbi:pyridoxal phosphate-dependent decarboxylase family protein [Paenibacillus jiagnxiensis]|uniref:pyridoxal phosphate-dependent decarboxylase family protein n=1 Tax=Paenibacillus jiagnxiensis TaxID=3228926 RepID=UPI0033A98DE6